jgi:hypothetical protein
MKQQKKIGRPTIPSHLKAKPISKTLRVPLEIIDAMKNITSGYRDGTISVSDIRRLGAMSDVK